MDGGTVRSTAMAVRRRLTARRVETAPPGKHGDGDGLELHVKAAGSRSWVLRYQIAGRRREAGLGRWPDVSLQRAREKAAQLRTQLGDGLDPLDARERRKVLTFRQAAEDLIEAKRPGWKNKKHAAQWGATLATYACPMIGDRDVRGIETADVLAVLRPVWSVKPETASRLRQRVEAVLDYSAALKARSGDNPARWRGHLNKLLPAPSKVRAVEHHAALDWREAPGFWRALAEREGTSARALAFTILTAARSGEVRGMTWSEVDVGSAVWTVPASRMKGAKEHRIPLVPAALALLGEPGEAGELIFAGAKPGRPMTDVSLAAVLRRMGRGDLTIHGLRSSFRDWAGETTNHPREVVEAALAHRLKDKVEASYARGDLFTKRLALMTDWSTFLEAEPASVTVLVSPTRTAAAAAI
jgi:integrase